MASHFYMVKERSLFFPAELLYCCLLSAIRAVCDADTQRWTEDQVSSWAQLPPRQLFLYVFAHYPEFRNVVRHRMRHQGGFWLRGVERILRLFYYGERTLFLKSADIGPGLRIQHGFATVVEARRIGSNVWINQQVSIGYLSANGCPVIGDDVRICAGAKVLGAITVGDHVRVGANAVVIKDVPPNCTVVGVPARIVKRNGLKCDEAL